MSSREGSSTSALFCDTIANSLSPARQSSTSFMVLGRDTISGTTIEGKTTTSLSGSIPSSVGNVSSGCEVGGFFLDSFSFSLSDILADFGKFDYQQAVLQSSFHAVFFNLDAYPEFSLKPSGADLFEMN